MIKRYSELKPDFILNNPNFKVWFGNSKVVDSSGKPLIVYHGTRRNFKEFSNLSPLNRIENTNEISKVGFFATNRIDIAEGYSDDRFNPESKGHSKILPLFFSLQNPKRMPLSLFYKEASKDGNVFRKNLVENGFDGVIAEGEYSSVEYVAFYPTQIKSALGNNGDFDPNNKDITK